MMNHIKFFDPIDIVEAGTGWCIRENSVDRVETVLNFLAGRELLLHELAPFAIKVRPDVQRQFPWLGRLEHLLDGLAVDGHISPRDTDIIRAVIEAMHASPLCLVRPF